MEWYASLGRSAEAIYYEESDWASARVIAMEMGRMLNAPRPSGQMLSAVWSAMGDLLSTEGQRRRLRFEIDRASATDEDTADDAAIIDLAQRLGAANE